MSRNTSRRGNLIRKRSLRQHDVRLRVDHLEPRRMLTDVCGVISEDTVWSEGEFTITCPVTVLPDVELRANPGVAVRIQSGGQITIHGELTFDHANEVFADYEYPGGSLAITVASGGVLDVINTVFQVDGDSRNNSTLSIQSGGHFRSVDAVYHWNRVELANASVLEDESQGNSFFSPLYVPISYLPALDDNQGLSTINIIQGDLPEGQRADFGPLGNDSPRLNYVFAEDFTIQQGATVRVLTGIPVAIAADALVTVHGTLLLLRQNEFTSSSGDILVTPTGTFEAERTTFTGSSGATIIVQEGGFVELLRSEVSWGLLRLESNANARLIDNVFARDLEIHSSAALDVRANDLSATTARVIAIGDPLQQIDFAHNYWGVQTTEQIGEKVTDGRDPGQSHRPLVVSSRGLTCRRACRSFSQRTFK